MPTDNNQITITLPWPPSVNHYWRASGVRRFISEEGQLFRSVTIVKSHMHKGSYINNEKLSVLVEAYPPDRRRRDLDNILKSLLDALQHAKVYADDNQIDKISVWRCPMLREGGKVVVTIGIIE